MNQIGMVILLIIKRAYQLGKFKGFVFRFLYDRYCPLPPPCCKHHKEQDSEHRQIDRPAKRPLRQKITQRRSLRLCSFLHISFGADNRQFSHLRQDAEYVSRIFLIQHSVIGKKQRSRNQNDFTLSPRTNHSHQRMIIAGNGRRIQFIQCVPHTACQIDLRQFTYRQRIITAEIGLAELWIKTEHLPRIDFRITNPIYTVPL